MDDCQRCADCGRVRLRTQIRRIFWIRGLTADPVGIKCCGRGLTRILGDEIFIIYNWALNFGINFQRANAANFTSVYEALAMSTVEIYN